MAEVSDRSAEGPHGAVAPDAEGGAPILALRYMLDFRCIGGECEDTCCAGGWTIYVDEGHFVKLRRLLHKVGGGAAGAGSTAESAPAPDPGQSSDGAQLGQVPFEGLMTPLPKEERTSRAFAKMLLTSDGRCPMLTSGSLCALHGQHGEAVLPDTCATYPRHVSRVGNRLELAGSMSCPEVARRALLPEDATDLVQAPRSLLGRGQLQQTAPDGPPGGDPRAAHVHLDEVRGTMVRLLGLDQFALTSRLFLCAFLAHKTDGLPRTAEGALHPMPLLRHTAQMENINVLTELDRRLWQSIPSAPPPILLLLSVFRAQRRVPGGENFARLVNDVMGSYAQEALRDGQVRTVPAAPPADGAAADDQAQVESFSPGWLSAAYGRRQGAVQGVFFRRIDRYLLNYARHFWMKDWYLQSPSLRQHAQGLLLRIALVRFLLLSHPDALAAAEMQPREAGEAKLDKLAVRIFYTLSRTIEHSDGFRELMAQELERHAPGVPDAIRLLAV